MSEVFRHVDDSDLSEAFTSFIRTLQVIAGHENFEAVVVLSSPQGGTTMTHTRSAERTAQLLWEAGKSVESRNAERWVDPPKAN